MKSTATLLFACLTLMASAQTTIYSEDFSSYAANTGLVGNGTGPSNSGDYPAGVSGWTLGGTTTGITASTDWVKTTAAEVLEFRDVDGAVVWESTAVNISSYNHVKFSIYVEESGDHEASNDSILISYSTDGGSTFADVIDYSNTGATTTSTFIGDYDNNGTFDDADFGDTTVTVCGLSGTSFILRVQASNGAGSEYIRIDDIEVVGMTLNDPTSVSNTAYNGTSTTISWTNPTSLTNMVVIGSTTAAVATVPDCEVDPTAWSSNSIFSSAPAVSTEIAGGSTTEKILYVGTGTSVTVTGLPSSGFLFYRVYTQLNPWSPGVTGSTPLPVEWLDFYAEKIGSEVALHWSTASEQNNSHFEILKSVNGIDFYIIGEIPGMGNTSDITEYQFIDGSMAAENFYQIRQVDYDGESSYSDLILVKNENEAIVVNSEHHVGLSNFNSDLESEVQVFDMMAKLVYTEVFEIGKDVLVLKSTFKAGVYVMNISNGYELKKVKFTVY